MNKIITTGFSSYFKQSYPGLISQSSFYYAPTDFIDKAPFYIRAVLTMISVLFLLHVFVMSGKYFHLLSFQNKQSLIQNWEGSSLLFKRKYIQLYKSIFILQNMDHYDQFA